MRQFEQYPANIPQEDQPVVVDIMGPADSLGLKNPNGATIITLPGYGEAADTWKSVSRLLISSAAAEGQNLNVVRYTDPHSYTQEAHSAVAEAVTRETQRNIAPGHRLYLLGHSRGGVTGARIGTGLVNEGIVDGIFTMATPVKGVPISPFDLAVEAFATPKHLINAEAVRVYQAFASNLARHARVDLEALAKARCPLEVAKAIGGRAMQSIREAQEVSSSDIRDELVTLAGMTHVMALFGTRDGLVPAKTNIQHLQKAGFTGPVVSLPGQTHCSMMFNSTAVAHVVHAVQAPKVLSAA